MSVMHHSCKNRRWIETKGKTLEEIDELIEGKKHSDVPDLEKVLAGKEVFDEHYARADDKEENE